LDRRLGFIYKITSPSNKIYIGQTIHLKKRINKYKNLNCSRQTKIYNSIIKYGFDNHDFEVICKSPIEYLNKLERHFQLKYDCLNNGLNCVLTNAGDNKMVLSDETKNKIRKSSLGKKMSLESRKKMSESKKGVNKLFKNHKSIKIISRNNVTDEVFISNLSGTCKYFGVDRELINSRLKDTVVNPRKLKDWSFYYG